MRAILTPLQETRALNYTPYSPQWSRIRGLPHLPLHAEDLLSRNG
jgi:hypothetical protein